MLRSHLRSVTSVAPIATIAAIAPIAAITAIVAIATLGSCQCDEGFALACVTTSDCNAGDRCVASTCVPRSDDAGVVVGEGEGEGASGEGEGEGEGEGASGEGEGEGASGEGEGEGEGEGCVDADGDGFVAASDGCDAGPADCDDADARVFPTHTEECDGVDNDCNGTVDDDEVCGCIAIRAGDADKRPRLLCLTPRTQADAQAECARRGYRLAQFDTAQDDDDVKAAFFDRGLHVWMSLKRQAHGSPTFVWGDGSAPAFSEFPAGQPDNTGNNEDCVEMLNDEWNDNNCARFFPFLCEPAPSPAATGSACVDGDGDGRGDGCAKGPDCDDGDHDVFALVGGAEDNDGDGFTADVRDLDCTDGTRATGIVPKASTATDCNDFVDDANNDCGGDPCIRPALVKEPPGLSVALCTDGTDFLSADDNCNTTFGRHLVAIDGQRIEDEVSQIVLAHREAVAWIGLDDIDSANQFFFENGDAFSLGTDFDDFAPAEPNDLDGNERCVAQDAGFGGWNDERCSNSHDYVCEAP